MFHVAIPVFAEGKEREKNYQLILRGKTADLKETILRVTAFSFYRLTVNGRFVMFGPARTAKGYARVDVPTLTTILILTIPFRKNNYLHYIPFSPFRQVQVPFFQKSYKRK